MVSGYAERGLADPIVGDLGAFDLVGCALVFHDSNYAGTAGAAAIDRPLRRSALLPIQLRQYDDEHVWFRRDGILVRAGAACFWAKEVAGYRAAGWQGPERVQEGLERVSLPDRVRDRQS